MRAVGSMRERAPGVWELRVYIGRDRDGHKRWVSRTHRGGRRSASRALALLEVQSDRSTPERCTVDQLCAMYVAARVANWSPSTAGLIPSAVDRLITPAIGDTLATELSVRDVERLLDRVAKSSPSMAVKVRSILSAAYEDGMRWEIVARNPARLARPPTVPAPRNTSVDVDAVRAVIAAATPAMALVIRLALVTGCRRGELVALRWCDVAGGSLTVARSIVAGKGALIAKGTKTGRVKVLALDAVTVNAVTAWRTTCDEEAQRFGITLTDDRYMFAQRPDGRDPWWPSTLTSRWRKLADAHGLEGVRLHDLRHTMITELMGAGVDPRTVADRAGHASATMALNRYAHAVPARDAEAADMLGRLLDG